MPDQDDKPLPNLDAPSAMEPLLKRIAEGVERLERKQPPAVPPSMSGGDSAPVMPPSQRQADQPPANLSPQQFANAGNINIEPPKGQQQPSIFGRAAISLQSMTNMMADYGVQSPMAHSLTSYAKTASLMAGDTHTRGEGLAAKGLRPNTGGDESAILRSLELGSRGRGQSEDAGDSSPQIARNDLKDSLDGLKESIDQLKEAIRQNDQTKGGAPKTVLQQASPSSKASAPQQGRSQPTQLSSVNLLAMKNLVAAFKL